jgi:hypothetical protein
MSVRTHTSSWRQFVAFAPLLGAAAVFMIAIQGEPEVLLSRNMMVALLAVSFAGWWVAWRLARVLSDTPVVAVAQARAGYVALRGTAQPMPNQPPLTSPSGAPCVWYYYSSGSTHRGGTYTATDSVQPFLLNDGAAECIVMPSGADITGGRHEGRERTIVAGDPIYVAGEFRPVSAGTLQQLREVEPERADVVRVSFSSDDTDPAAFRAASEAMLKAATAAKAAAARERAASNASAPLALPLVCKPADARPFMISANQDGAHEGSWYGWLARANLLLLVASGVLLSFLLWTAR